MKQLIKQSTVILIIAALFFLPAIGFSADSEVTSASIAGDTLVMRPLGVVATVLGAAFFVVSLPFSVWGGNVGKSFKATIAKPAEYTFVRGIGDFDEGR